MTQRLNFDLEIFDEYSDPLAFTQQRPSQGASQQPGLPGPSGVSPRSPGGGGEVVCM